MTTPVDTSARVREAKSRMGIVGNAPSLMEAVQRAIRVAPIDLSVLVVGESGTGKEFFPKLIHNYGSRKHAKYIAVNCGAIPEGTIDSELFGHEKGSFTGAVATRKGYFEEADGGTIFLDEVAELPLTTQARLLRVLETGEFLKVGSSTVQRTNIRIVAATNVDMAKAIAEGRFREDLYYRLSTVQISVPPLRDRGSDIALLARKFAADFAERYRMPAISLSAEAVDAMERFRWPGNVRQLKNIVEQVALFEAGTEVTDSVLASYMPLAPASGVPVVSVVGSDSAHSYGAERELIFNMIFSMRNEIDTLRATIETLEGRGDAAATPYSPTREAEEYDVPHSLVKFNPSLHDMMRPLDDTDAVAAAETPRPTSQADSPAAGQGARTLEDTERETIRRSLLRNEGRRKATAQELNISERTLYRKIKEYGLE